MNRITSLCASGFLLLCFGAGDADAAPRPEGLHPALSQSVAAAAEVPQRASGKTFRDRILRPTADDLRLQVTFRHPIGTPQRRAMAALGTVEVVVDARAQVLIPRFALNRLAKIGGVEHVRWPRVVSPKSTSEGLDVMGVRGWHDSGELGEGVTVGVIDPEFALYDSLSESALPVLDAEHVSWAPSMGGPGEGPHGTACAEIIHEIAPAADLYIASVGTELEFESQLQWLVDQDVDIVSASLGWDNMSPQDGTSPLATAVDAASDAGVLYVGAAGNEGEQYWTGTWSDADADDNCDFLSTYENRFPVFINDYGYDFGPDSYGVAVRWLEDWDTASVDIDVELYLADINDPNTVVAELGGGTETQDGSSAPPFEAVFTEVALSDGQGIFARVYVADGDPTGLTLKVFGFPGPLPAEYRVREGSLTSPADARTSLTVGAVQHSDLMIAPYSSEGPTEDGRQKPDVFGISHVTTESYGPFIDDEDEPGFNGTSAATPHVAGVAALLWGAQDEPDRQTVWDAIMDSVDTTMITGGGSTAGSGLVVLDSPAGDDDDAAGDDDDAAGDDDDAAGDDDDAVGDDDDWLGDDDDADGDGEGDGCACSSASSTGAGLPLLGVVLFVGFVTVRRRAGGVERAG